MRLWRVAILFTFLLLLISVNASVQAQERIVIPLTINLEFAQSSGQIIAFRVNDAPMSYTTPIGHRLGDAPGSVLFSVESVPASANSYRLMIDADGDGDLRNDTAQTLAANSTVIVKLSRKWANEKRLALPYSIRYSRDTDSRGRMREMFLWSPHYRAEGRLKVGNCENLFTVLDLNTDGQFNQADRRSRSFYGKCLAAWKGTGSLFLST